MDRPRFLTSPSNIGGGLKNDTPSCIAAVLKKAPADIFEKCFWCGAAFAGAHKVGFGLWALFLHLF